MNAIANINADRTAWLDARRKGIGGSDVAAMLGLSQYNTPYTLWLDKTGRDSGDSDISEPAYWGNTLEDIVAQEFAKRSGNKIQRVNQLLVGEQPWMLANIDRAVVNREISGRVYLKDGRLTTDQILECKTANGFLAKLWGDTEESVPDYYLTQCQWYLGITQAEICHMAVLIGGQSFRMYRIQRDDELIDMLQSEARTFWNDYVLADQPPDPTTLSDCAHRWAAHTDGQVHEADDDMAVLISEYKALGEAIKEAESNRDEMKLQIVKTMQEAEVIMHGGKKLLTYKTQEANRFDTKSFRAEHPDLADQFTKTSTSRVLRLK